MIKQTHKIFALIALSASLVAGNLEDAVLKFGGGSNVAVAAERVLAKKGQLQGNNAFSVANALKTPEALSLGRFLAKDKKTLFNKANMSEATIQSALQDLVGNRMAPVMIEPSAPQLKEEVGSTIIDPNGNPLSQEQFDQVIEATQQAIVHAEQAEKVIEQQQLIDAAAASQNSELLQSAITKSSSTLEACLNVVDVMFENVRQAIAAMDDADMANKVVARVKQNASSLSAVSTKSKAKTLGRMSSKKNKKARA